MSTIYENFKREFPWLHESATDIREDGCYLIVTSDQDCVWLYDDIFRRVRRLPQNSNGMSEREFRTEFAERLFRYMRINGIVESELAELVGVSQPTISNYISGRSMPSFYMVDKIAKALNTPIEKFIYR